MNELLERTVRRQLIQRTRAELEPQGWALRDVTPLQGNRYRLLFHCVGV